MKNILLTIIIMLLPVVKLFAQVPPPPSFGEDASSGPGAPSNAPIDSYEILLIGAALLLSVYFLYRNKQIAKA